MSGGEPERGDGVRAEIGRQGAGEPQAREAGPEEGRRGPVARDAGGHTFLEQLRERLVERVGELDGGSEGDTAADLSLVVEREREVERAPGMGGQPGEGGLADQHERHPGKGLDALARRPDDEVRTHLLEIEPVSPDPAHRVDEEELATRPGQAPHLRNRVQKPRRRFVVHDRYRLDVRHTERALHGREVGGRQPVALDHPVGQARGSRHGGDALAVYAVGDHDQAAALGEDTCHRHLERRRTRAREENRREASRRREGREESCPDAGEQLLAFRLAMAEVAPRERRRDACRDVHRPGVEQDHRATPRVRRSRDVISSGACGTRGPGGPGGPSAMRTSRKAGPSRVRNSPARSERAARLSTRPAQR